MGGGSQVHHLTSGVPSPDGNCHSRDLDLACMSAVAAVTAGLPLDTGDSERGDIME